MRSNGIKLGHMAAVLLVILAACFITAAIGVGQCRHKNAERTFALQAVASGIGISSLALSREGSSSRNPTDGPAGCLADIPGGYCLHDICDVITCPGQCVKSVSPGPGRAAP